jgi:hypothetical protein
MFLKNTKTSFSSFSIAFTLVVFLCVVAVIFPHQVRATTLLSDSFTGTAIDTDIWTEQDSAGGGGGGSAGNVQQNNVLTVIGSQTYGANGLTTVDTFDRTTGDLTLEVDVTNSDCSAGAGTPVGIGYGNPAINTNPSDSYIVAHNDGELEFFYFNNGSIITRHELGISCTSDVPFHIKLVILEAGGAELYVDGDVTPTDTIAEGTFTDASFYLHSHSNTATVTYDDFSLTGPDTVVALSCSVETSCASGVVLYRMSGTDNAHAELPAQSNYTQLVCCTGITDLGNSCSGTYQTVLKLSGTTNAHVEQNSQSNYANNACISAPSGGSVTVAYQESNCTGYDTTIGSMSAATNAHVGNGSAYTTKICGSATEGSDQTLTFNISDNAIGFGSLVTSGARYATADATGSGTDSADAHTISVATNASSGYVMTATGTTLTCASCGGATISAIGGSAAASSAGTEQFGLRLIVNSGTGSASSPYASSNWAFDTAALPDEIATGDGDESSTEFGVRYIANIAPSTENGSYASTLTYIVTATY